MEEFERKLKIICLITTIINTLGLIGNVFSFLTFSRKAFSKSSIHIYCRALAIFDSFILLLIIFDLLFTYMNLDLKLHSNATCKSISFLIAAIVPISGWILVAFSIDQIITAKSLPPPPLPPSTKSFSRRGTGSGHRHHHHMTAYSNNTKNNYTNQRIAIVVGICVVHVLLYAWVPVWVEHKERTIFIRGHNVTTMKSCNPRNLPHAHILAFFYWVESGLAPFVVMMCTTSLIAKTLYESRKSLGQMGAQLARKVKDRKYALNSVVLNLLFIVLTSPLLFRFIFNSSDYLKELLELKIASLLFFLNYAFHFLAHFVVNSVFRVEFLKMVGLRGKMQLPTSTADASGCGHGTPNSNSKQNKILGSQIIKKI